MKLFISMTQWAVIENNKNPNDFKCLCFIDQTAFFISVQKWKEKESLYNEWKEKVKIACYRT